MPGLPPVPGRRSCCGGGLPQPHGNRICASSSRRAAKPSPACSGTPFPNPGTSDAACTTAPSRNALSSNSALPTLNASTFITAAVASPIPNRITWVRRLYQPDTRSMQLSNHRSITHWTRPRSSSAPSSALSSARLVRLSGIACAWADSARTVTGSPEAGSLSPIGPRTARSRNARAKFPAGM